MRFNIFIMNVNFIEVKFLSQDVYDNSKDHIFFFLIYISWSSCAWNSCITTLLTGLLEPQGPILLLSLSGFGLGPYMRRLKPCGPKIFLSPLDANKAPTCEYSLPLFELSNQLIRLFYYLNMKIKSVNFIFNIFFFWI